MINKSHNKKIKLCNTNDIYNNAPEIMINDDGKHYYAYLTFIYDDKNISGAIVLAESIKKLGCLADLIVMTTNNISNEGINILKIFFDHVINIEYIDLKIDNNELFFIKELTKLKAFTLTEYKKIILIKPNSIILKYPEHLFTLNTPACIYLNNKKCFHNKLLSKKTIDKIKFNNYNEKEILLDNIILLEPNQEKYNMMIRNLKTSKILNIVKNFEYPFIEYLNLINTDYGISLYGINEIFLKTENPTHWSKSFGIYFLEEPYILENKIPITQRIQDENYQLWFSFYKNITNKYPNLLDSSILNNPNEMSKKFITQLSRITLNYKRLLSKGIMNAVNKIFHIEDPQNYFYYHLNISKEYDNEAINYLFEDDFIQNMIMELIRLTKSKYFTQLLNKSQIQKKLIKNELSNKINDEFLKNYDVQEKENILSYYSKINSNVSIILFITSNENENNFWLDNNLITNILYKKVITLNGYILKNILFNIFQMYSYEERTNKLNNLFTDMTEYKINILIYKTIIDSNLKGNNKDVFVLSDTNIKLRALSILFNKNTLEKFINGNIKFIFDKKNIYYEKNMLIYQTLKKWIYNNYDGIKMDSVIILEPVFLYKNKLIKKITILDTNIYSNNEDIIYKNYNKNKPFFLKTIFSIDKEYKNYKNIIDNINNPLTFYILDGIKFIL
jgi:hypothetical protein